MGFPLTDNGSLDIKDPIVTLCHTFDHNGDPMRDLIRHHPKCLLTDQLRCDLAHRLIRHRILVIILRPLRKILEDRVDQSIRVGFFHCGNRYDLLKPVHVLIGIDRF